jgi:hypothetical protein
MSGPQLPDGGESLHNASLHNASLAPGVQVKLLAPPLYGLTGTVRSIQDERVLVQVRQGAYVRCPSQEVEAVVRDEA